MQAPLAKSNNIPPPPATTAAHVRTMRKGSSDHLAINIESESERFINDKGSDEDKGNFIKNSHSILSLMSLNLHELFFAGHAFKPLVTSGLIPRQGRTLADRVDGIW